MAKEDIEINDDVATKILFGSITLLLLMIAIGIPAWTKWVSEELVGGLLSVFFIAPLFGAILTRSFPKEMVMLIVIGGSSLLVYKWFTGVTWMGLAIIMLTSFTAVSLFSVTLDLMYKFGAKKIPP